LSDVHFPDAKQIVLVQDNLNTHTAASLYATFPAEEARRLAKRFEWHYTPKHGSWLDMAESELAVLTSQCLDRRIPNKPSLETEVAAWQAIETSITPKPIGSSRPTTPASNSRGSTPNFERLGRLEWQTCIGIMSGRRPLHGGERQQCPRSGVARSKLGPASNLNY
jgi:hypothetical protein